MKHLLRHLLPTAATCLLATLPLTGCSATPTPAASDDWFAGGPMKPATAETLQLTARVLASKGNTEQAGFVIDRMAREYPDNLGTYTEGAEVLLIEGRIQEAIGWLDRGLARFPNQPVLRNDRGMCRLLEADLAAVTADFEAAYAADPSDADFVGNLALAKALAGDTAGARALWSRMLRPEDVEHNLATAEAAKAKFKRPREL
ncbi:MAG: tetratricopeptide repeat protein [Planctomycetota bacterium]